MKDDVDDFVCYARPALPKRWRFALPPLLAVCMAATGGAVAWDAMNPWANPIDAAIRESESVPPNTLESKGVAVRLLDVTGAGARALRTLEERGDTEAGFARKTLRWWIEQGDQDQLTVEQIRARYQGMSRDAFDVWFAQAMK
jgi:hypothetical protein